MLELAPYMTKYGIYWGAGFTKVEDSHHFEVSDWLVKKWAREGVPNAGSGPVIAAPPPGNSDSERKNTHTHKRKS